MQNIKNTQEQLTTSLINGVVIAQIKLFPDSIRLVEELNDIFDYMFRFDVKAFDSSDEELQSINILYTDPITEKDKVLTFKL